MHLKHAQELCLLCQIVFMFLLTVLEEAVFLGVDTPKGRASYTSPRSSGVLKLQAESQGLKGPLVFA